MLQLGLIGYGAWGKRIYQTLRTIAGVKVVIITRGHTAPTLDGVLIATPAATHTQVALPFLRRGTAVFVEKPMTTSVRDAMRFAAARKSRAVIFVGHVHLFNPAFQKAQGLLPQIGPLRGIICEAANDRPRSDSSIFWDWLPHHLSIACALRARRPVAAEARALMGFSRANLAVSKFDFGGVPVVSVMSWLSPRKRNFLTIVGSRGALMLDAAENKVTLQKGRTIKHFRFKHDAPLKRELAAFAKCVRAQKNDIEGTLLDDGVAIVRMIAAAEKSARHGGRKVAINYPAR